ncbi:MAG: type IV pilus secretin PilQ [Gammaproteobacteria bacterium]|nr:type IV pilus secretin PilQ [Gammaproteobacteria bacterium]
MLRSLHKNKFKQLIIPIGLLVCFSVFAAEPNKNLEFTLETPDFSTPNDNIETQSEAEISPLDPMVQAQIRDIRFSSMPGEKVKITIELNQANVEPTSFTVDSPARIALDFPNTTSKLDWRTRKIGIGPISSIAAIEANQRTRIVINLVKQVAFSTRFEDKAFILEVDAKAIASAPADKSLANFKQNKNVPTQGITSVDFRRGNAGEGRVVVTFSSNDVVADIREEGGRIVVDYLNANVVKELQQRLDVVDFATPVSTIDTFKQGNNVRMVITPNGQFQHIAYQSDNTLTIDLKPLTPAEKAEARQAEYVGEKLSLNFQDIEVRAVLQLLADFTSLNIVVSDTVKGSITLRLKSTPWDQAMDIILKAKGLSKRQTGNVILVAPASEIAEREQLELLARKQISELAPLHSELVQVNYAKAQKLAEIIKSDKNTLLSARGNITVDERTNTLLIRDTFDRLAEIRKLIGNLDIPIRQVMIESRIVIASDSFSKDMGIRFGIGGTVSGGGGSIATAGTSSGMNNVISGASFGDDDNFNINLPLGSGTNGPKAPSFSLGFLSSTAILDLELAAMQAEGQGEVVSSPRVITSNQKEALIEQGEEIPYQEASSSGASTTSFRKAVMSLKVTPQITPDDRIILDLKVNKDSRSTNTTGGGAVAIDTKEIQTQVLVENGETVVLGGIYEQQQLKEVKKVPLLGDIPFLGALFRTTSVVNAKTELLIFVTPKILKENFSLN